MRIYPTLIGQQAAAPASFLIGTYAACHELSVSGTKTFQFDPANIPGLQTGDILIMACMVQPTSAAAAGFQVPSGWYYITGGGALNNGIMESGLRIVYRFYDSGDTAYTFTANPSAVSGQTCYQVRAFRGVSRRKPIDFIWRTEHDPSFTVGLPFTGMRAHGDSPAIVCVYHANAGDSSVPEGFMTFSAANKSWRTLEDVAEWAKVVPSGAANNFGVWDLCATVDKSTLQNVTGLEYTFATDIPGFAFSTMQWDTAPSAASGDCDKDGFSSTSTSTVAHYLTATVNLAVDDVLVVCARHNGNYSSSSAASNYYLMPVLVQPDATTIGGRAHNQDTAFNTSWNGDFTTVNPYPMNQRFQASEAYAAMSYKMSGLVHRATQDGDHEIRLYACRGTKALSWQVSTTGSEVAISLASLGIGVSKNGSPPPMHTHKDPGSATEFGSNDVVPVPVFFSGPDNVSWTGTTEWAQIDQYQIVLDDATLLSTQLSRTHNAQPPLLYDDAGKLNIDGTTQYRFCGDPWIVRADTVLLPTYRTAEGGADTDGKYYWEITVEETVNDISCAMGIAIPGMFDPEAGTNRFQQGSLDHHMAVLWSDGDLEYGAAGRTNAWTTAGWTAGDIFSFALDIPAGTLSIYKNGVLLVGAIDLTTSASATEATYFKQCPWIFVAKLEDSPGAVVYSNDIIPITANFKGPFTYTKPVGYVAYDWPNEVA